jgi:hypothetical protein
MAMRLLCVITIILFLFFSGSSCKKSQEKPLTEEEEKIEENYQAPMTEEGQEPEGPVDGL